MDSYLDHKVKKEKLDILCFLYSLFSGLKSREEHGIFVFYNFKVVFVHTKTFVLFLNFHTL